MSGSKVYYEKTKWKIQYSSNNMQCEDFSKRNRKQWKTSSLVTNVFTLKDVLILVHVVSVCQST